MFNILHHYYYTDAQFERTLKWKEQINKKKRKSKHDLRSIAFLEKELIRLGRIRDNIECYYFFGHLD